MINSHNSHNNRYENSTQVDTYQTFPVTYTPLIYLQGQIKLWWMKLDFSTLWAGIIKNITFIIPLKSLLNGEMKHLEENVSVELHKHCLFPCYFIKKNTVQQGQHPFWQRTGHDRLVTSVYTCIKCVAKSVYKHNHSHLRSSSQCNLAHMTQSYVDSRGELFSAHSYT